MPAIKKKWIKASQDGTDFPDDTEGTLGDEDKELGDGGSELAAPRPKKRPAPPLSQSGLLRGLDGEVLLEKRKRFVPPAELKLSEWLEHNLEKRTEVSLHVPHLYSYYTELCQGDGSDIVDIPEFNRMVREKFGKTFGLKETSVYKGLLKEKKINEEKKKTSAGIKMKDVVHEAINHFGNPWNGVRFFSLKQFIGTKYPALQIDLRPKILKRTLEMGLHWGKIDLVKGIGMAGFYRLPGGEPPAPKQKAKKTGEDVRGEEEGTDGQSSQEEQGEDEKLQKETNSGEEKGKGEDMKKKKTKPKKEKVSLSRLNHGSPKQIEDTFPLAITYQSAPKAAGIPRIRRYIQEKYGETVSDSRWRSAIEKGADKGYWEHVSGSGITGSLHLLMDDFNPGSDQIEDMICAAIIACHEPKATSANQIKKYVSQYHPEFKVDERPDKFKKALLRAVTKNIIVQLSGLGANGSFQLTSHFTPSPNVLAGENDSSGEEEGYESDEPVYIPKGTKSRGMPKIKTMEVISSPAPKPGKTKGSKKSSSSFGKGRGRHPQSYAESSNEESIEAPLKKDKKSPLKRNPSKNSAKKQVRSPLSDEIESENEPEYTPRKSQSRGGSAALKSKVGTSAKQSIKMATKSRKKRAIGSQSPAESKTELGSSLSRREDKKSEKAKKSSRSAVVKNTQASKITESTKKPRLYDSDADVESEIEQEYTPRKSKSRGGEESGAENSYTAKKDKRSKGKRSK